MYSGSVSYQNIVNRYNNWWTLELLYFYYGEVSVHTSTVQYAVIDSSQSMIYMAKTDWLNFKTAVLAQDDPVFQNMVCSTILFGYCYSNSHTCDYFESSMQPITIRLNNNLY